MAVFVWSDSYSVGNNKMDQDHMKLFSILNVMLDAMKDGRGEEVVESQLNELASYAKYHFDEEEKLMLSVNYPGLAAQQQSHKAFLEKVVAYQAEVTAGNGAYVITEAVFTVKDWLKSHIMTMDMQYESYLTNSLKKSA